MRQTMASAQHDSDNHILASLSHLSPRHPVPDKVDEVLSTLAARAGDHNRDLRNALYFVYLPKLEPTCYALWRTIGRSLGVDLEDIQQHAFVVFCDMLESWNRRGSFTANVLSSFKYRLGDATRKLGNARPRRTRPRQKAVSWNSHAPVDEESIMLLEEMCQSLDDFHAQIVLYKVQDGMTTSEIARLLGVNRRTVQRSWKSARETLSMVLFDKR